MPRKRTASPLPVRGEQPGNKMATTLAALIQGSEPSSRDEAFLAVRWKALTRDQKQALAAEWNLPAPKKADERLARQAIQELGNLSL